MFVATYAMFRDALASGDLNRVMQLARNLGQSVRLDDALRVCLLVRDEPERFQRAAVRWLGRFALEGRAIVIADLQEAADALDAMPGNPAAAMERLAALCIAHGVG
jgi:hypothetical protein